MSPDVPPQSGEPSTLAEPAPPAGRPPGPGRPSLVGRTRRFTPGTWWLLAARLTLAVAAAITLMITALAVGSRLDDRQIEAHLGTATATVLSVSALHTGIEFVDAAGIAIRPPDGVLYPGLLSVGQRFQVEYSTLDPALVRVAGRTAAVGNVILAITLAVTWLVAVVLSIVLRRRSAALARRAAPEGAVPAANGAR